MTGGTILPGDCSDPGLFEETSEIDFSGTDKFGIAMANQSRQEYVQVTLGLILSENRLCHRIRNPVRERMEPFRGSQAPRPKVLHALCPGPPHSP